MERTVRSQTASVAVLTGSETEAKISRHAAGGAAVNTELASYLGLVGPSIAIAAFSAFTLIGIFFVRLLDSIEGFCTRAAIRSRS
jgi:hypothetical protein